MSPGPNGNLTPAEVVDIVSGVHDIPRAPLPSWLPTVLVTISIALLGVGGAAVLSKFKADESYTRTATLENRTTTLEAGHAEIMRALARIENGQAALTAKVDAHIQAK